MRNLSRIFQTSPFTCHCRKNTATVKQMNRFNINKIINRTILLECYENIPDDIDDMVKAYMHIPQTSISLQNLMRTGQGEYLHKLDKIEVTDDEKILIQVSNFLRRELPIRLAHRIHDLNSAPLFCDMPSVKEVRNTYIKTFYTLIQIKQIETIDDERKFAGLLLKLYDRHSNVLIQMARGAFELREAVREGNVHVKGSKRGSGKIKFEHMNSSHDFLDRFYMTRIGLRVLVGQYLALRQQHLSSTASSTKNNNSSSSSSSLPEEEYIGFINLHSSPYEIVQQAADDAALICCRKYGDAPDVNIQGRLDLTFPYIPTHLHYIALELIKNSMRATVDFHGVDNDFPSIDVIIADGKENEDVVIKVEDKGGGIPRSDMPKIWSYLFTTADPVIQEGLVAFSSKSGDHSIDSPLAGLGYGLPISRSYARYFGGDLSIMSMEGYGTDAFIYLKRLGDAKEPNPI